MAMPKKDKKKQSIREFVNENDIMFELYHMKFSNQLKQLDRLSTEEIKDKWAYDTNKKINRFKNDLTKKENSSEIAQTALKHNIKYLENLPAPISEEDIKNNFNKVLKDYEDSVYKRLQDQDNPAFTIKKLQDTITYIDKLKVQGLQRNPNKERFGTMLLLMIKNLATMPSFSGYSENWATDFYSNAVEKVILYLDNFDENLLSKRSGGKSKAFAYVTQICFNAFVNIINIRKKEDEFLKQTISYETHNFDGVQDLTTRIKENDYNPSDSEDDIEVSKVFEIILTRKDLIGTSGSSNLEAKIIKSLEAMIQSNTIIKHNKSYKDELEELQTPGYIPEEEKTQDYYDYINELKEKILTVQNTDNIIKNILLVKVPEGSDLTVISKINFKEKLQDPTDASNIDIIITSNKNYTATKATKNSKTSKQKVNKNSFNGYDPKTGLTKEEQLLLQEHDEVQAEEQEFYNEW